MIQIFREEGRGSKRPRCFSSMQEVMKDNLWNTCGTGAGPASEGRMVVIRACKEASRAPEQMMKQVLDRDKALKP